MACRSALVLFPVGAILLACTGETPIAHHDDDVTVDTRARDSRRQYDANITFASRYVSRCAPALEGSSRPRVLVTGFGRFMDITNNAT